MGRSYGPEIIMSIDASADFAIASDLLGEAGEGLAWSNLGAWSPGLDYAQACRQLALVHGQAAELAPGQEVLDLACGSGASLMLWSEAFGVAGVTGLELQADCLARIRRSPPPALQGLYQARFDQLPLPPGLPAQAFDAVLCVDAAYHASSLSTFAAFAAQALRPGGRLAFSTLVQTPVLGGVSPREREVLFWLLARAGIPTASFLTPEALSMALQEQGFGELSLSYQDEAVLGGFAAFADRHQPALSWVQRYSPGWLKIAATAWLCRQLYRRGWAHYVVVSARLSQ